MKGTMLPVQAGDRREVFTEAYKCRICQGVYFARRSDPSYGTSPEETASEVACSLCDDATAPLSKRYWMALTTLAWAYLENGGCATKTKASDFGFPSFNEVFIDRLCFEGGSTFRFTYKGADITAEVATISWFPPTPFWSSFVDIIDSEVPCFSTKTLASELVNRVRHDLKLNYAKEA